ncbi:L,D-transpeptidase family protein [Hyalangium versicolor]|uniref:L,D-transpeptidase family protein n=1 Tax=Hyalangium versicolor TaxID=2861190 RepID=UPI001CCF38BF|nr:L,D-transpeptidase family protein [Hyalangium versicolor]
MPLVLVVDAGVAQSSPLPPVTPVEESPTPPLVLSSSPELEVEPGLSTEELEEASDSEPLEPEDEAQESEPALELGLDLRADIEEDADTESGGSEETPGEHLFKSNTRSLKARRSIVVRAEPRKDAAPIGTLAQDMRVRWKQVVKGTDCDAWVEIEPRGWICERYLESNFREPRTRDLPLLGPEQLTPGVYAHVSRRARVYLSLAQVRQGLRGRRVKGSVTVQLASETRVGRRRFWRTTGGKFIEARYLRVYTPSEFVGLDRAILEALPMPLAWVQSRATPREPVVVRMGPEATAERETVLPPRTLVALQELSTDGQWARIADAHWVAIADLHRIGGLPVLSDLAPDERWLDVDLQEQVLVAYEGERPVYATLISSGARQHETPEGLFRIWLKSAEADMTGDDGRNRYLVATVPWTMFFQGNFALHTAYWHDRFGEPVSHGCINLAPRDARELYRWSSPEVPSGWSMVYGTEDVTGSRIRIHSGPEQKEGPPLSVAASSAPSLQ